MFFSFSDPLSFCKLLYKHKIFKKCKVITWELQSITITKKNLYGNFSDLPLFPLFREDSIDHKKYCLFSID